MDAENVPRVVWLFFKDIDDWDRFYKFPGRIWNLFKKRDLENSILNCGRIVNTGLFDDFLGYSPAKTGHFWVIPFEHEGYGKDAYKALENRLTALCDKYPFLDITYRDQHPPVSKEDAEKAIITLARINNMSVEEMRKRLDECMSRAMKELESRK